MKKHTPVLFSSFGLPVLMLLQQSAARNDEDQTVARHESNGFLLENLR